MKITYMENPLETTVELDEKEKEIFLLNIKLLNMEENRLMAEYALDDGNMKNVKEYISRSLDDKSFEEYVQRLYDTYLEELMSSHVGDCICVACSCMKCHAESILGIDTISGCNKYMGNSIFSAFRKYKNIDTVIEKLDNYKVELSPKDEESWEKAGGYSQHIERWTNDAKKSAEWLKKYKLEKLNK